jgi:hypothetical protein
MTEQLSASNEVGIRSERDVRYDQTPAWVCFLIHQKNISSKMFLD